MNNNRFRNWSSKIFFVGSLVTLPAFAGEIDFEGLAEGQVINEVSNGAGATGLPNGSVGVFGFNPAFGPGVNAAIVFDSSCPPGGVPSDCSGGTPNDVDLGTPNETFGDGPGVGMGGEQGMPFENGTPLSNIAIVAENLVDAGGDGNVDDPDDADLQGQSIAFDFTSLNLKKVKSVTVNSVTYVDNDEGEFNAEIQFFGPGTLNPSVIGLPPVGDNGVNTLEPGIEGVEQMVVVLNGSGAVASVTIDEEPVRDCWVTTGGFDKGVDTNAAGQKICTFGGNIGPPSSGAFEVNWHGAAPAELIGAKFHTNDINVVRCEDNETTGPGQPGGKKGLLEDTLLFTCTGSFNGVSGHTCEGFLQDGGEPGGKKGNDPDRIEMVVKDSDGVEVARCDGDLEGGNVQIHPPVGK